MLCWHRHPSLFGNMRIMRPEHENAVAAKTRRQTINQKIDLGFFITTGIKVNSLRRDALHAASRKSYQIKTKTRIKWIGKHSQLLAEKSPNNRGITRRSVSYTHLRAHETGRNLVCRL